MEPADPDVPSLQKEVAFRRVEGDIHAPRLRKYHPARDLRHFPRDSRPQKPGVADSQFRDRCLPVHERPQGTDADVTVHEKNFGGLLLPVALSGRTELIQEESVRLPGADGKRPHENSGNGQAARENPPQGKRDVDVPGVGEGNAGYFVPDIEFLQGDAKMQRVKPKRPEGNSQAPFPGLLPDTVLRFRQNMGDFLLQPPDPEGKEYDEEESHTDPPRPTTRHKGKL